MLQQTRVETVIPYFERFLGRFPTPLALAEAPEDEVLGLWSGLGYYRRARLLHAGARWVAEHGRALPDTREGLLALPGVGRYTAGAIASIAFGCAVGLVDGNVARVLARLFAIEGDMRKAGMRTAEALADELVDPEQPGAWNQALMELGATVCTPRSPACGACPVAKHCVARAEGRQAELPFLSEKAKPKAQAMQAVVATSASGEVLLARRRVGGLFGGLWEPPLLEGKKGAREELRARLRLASLAPAGRVVHVLSHRRLTVDVHVARLDAAPSELALPAIYETAALFGWAAIEAGARGGPVGVATLAQKILAAAKAV